jgi:hypothetical protein
MKPLYDVPFQPFVKSSAKSASAQAIANRIELMFQCGSAIADTSGDIRITMSVETARLFAGEIIFATNDAQMFVGRSRP